MVKKSRSLGQVFLRDKKYIKKILSSLNIKGRIVCEIGPGRGQLTSFLLERAKLLYCIEIDPHFYAFLKSKFKNVSNVEIIHSNILKFPLSRLKKRLIVFGNVPYHISSRLIRYLVDNRTWIEKAYLMFQKEFSHKLIAEVSTKLYTFLSCYIQYYARLKKLFDVPSRAFYPKPQVNSSFLEIEFLPQPLYETRDEKFLFEIIRQTMSHRRKKITNSLPILKEKGYLLTSLKIDSAKRANELSLKEYIDLANSLYQQNLKNR